MFNLFRKKENVKISDRIVIDEESKWQVLLDYFNANQGTTMIAWFDETATKANEWFAMHTRERVPVVMARETSSLHLAGKPVVFIEHYPLHQKEKGLFERLQLSHVIVYSALREPLFARFGGERIIELMNKLGMNKNEVIEHAMISSSIRNAQNKLENKIVVDHHASSQEQWLQQVGDM